MVKKTKILFRCLLLTIIPIAIKAVVPIDSFSQEIVEIDKNEAEEFDFANGLFSRGMYSMAVEEYQKFIDKYPISKYRESAHYRIGESFFLAKDNMEALARFKKFKEQYPEGVLTLKAALREGQIFYRKGELERAKEQFQALTEAKGDPEIAASAIYYLTGIQRKLGEDEESVEKLLGLVSAHPDSKYIPFAYMDLGDAHLRSEDPGKSVEFYDKAAALSRSEKIKARANLGAGYASYLLKDYASAQKYYKKVIAAPAEKEAFTDAATGLVAAYYYSGDYDKVIKEASVLAGKVEASEKKAQILYMLGSAYFSRDMYDDAVNSYSEAARGYPDTQFGKKSRLNEAWALYRAKKLEKSLESVDHFLRNPERAVDEALYLKAKILAGIERFEESIMVYAKLLDKFKESEYYKEALYDTGWLSDETRDFEKASIYYRKFVNGYPDDERSPEVLLKTAQNNLNLGKYAEAEKDYSLFLERYGDNPLEEKVLYQLGKVYIGMEKFDKLIKIYERFLEEHPASEVTDAVVYWIGFAYQEAGNWDKAPKFYKKLGDEKTSEYYKRSREAIAFAMFQKGEFEKSAGFYLMMITTQPGYRLPEGVYQWTAEQFFDENKSRESLTVIEAYLKNYPEVKISGMIMCMAAENHRRLGEYDIAGEKFRKAIDAEDAETFLGRIYLGLGRNYRDMGDNKQALESFEKALKMHKDHMVGAYARFETAAIMGKMSRYNEAAKMYMMVAILYDEKELCPRAIYLAADAYKQAGDFYKADEMYHELIDRYPDDPLSEKAKKELTENI